MFATNAVLNLPNGMENALGVVNGIVWLKK